MGVATVMGGGGSTHQTIEPVLKWKKKKMKWRGAKSGLEGEGLKGSEEGDNNNNNNSEGLGIDRASGSPFRTKQR